MSSIALTSNGLAGDYEILFDDETDGGDGNVGLRMIRRASGATTTVHTTQSLYSAVADKTDEFLAMGFENPMTPTTPNAFVMENGYFIPRSSTEFLKEGAISADWSSGDDDEIRSILHDNTGTPPDSGDIGFVVTGGTTGDTGTLLDFETLPDGTFLLWIRPDTTADTFQNAAETLTATSGLSVNSTALSSAGTQLYSSIQVIGAVPTATEVYLYQDRNKMTSADGTFQWWTTDSTVSLGIIDILIRVERDSTSISDGDVEVFARRYTALYDNFRLNVSGGGRSALPLASNTDINNSTGYRAAAWNNGTGSAMQVGDLLTNTTAAGGGAVVTAVTDSGATGTFEYYLVSELIDFSNLDSFTSVNRNGDINGAPTANLTGPTDPAAGEGGTVTITLGTTDSDFDGDGTDEAYSITVDAQSDVPVASVYERIKYVTRRGADEADLFGAGVNTPGESYRGLEALAYYDTPSGTFGEGEDVDIAAKPNFSARSASVNTTATQQDVNQVYVMLMGQETSLEAIANNDILLDEGADSVTLDTAGAGGAIDQFTSPKSSPLGTFTGSQIFGARGVLYINPGSGDSQAYILTDDVGQLRNPPNSVTILVQNTAAGDRILYARDVGTGVIDKDQFGGVATGVLGATTITVTGSIDSEVPPAGFVRVVDNANQEEHRYRYASRTTGASGVFTLVVPTGDTGSATSASTTQLIDTGGGFQGATPVVVGDMVRNTFAGKTTHVWEVTNVVSDTVLDVQVLYGPGGASQDWDSGDTYEINKLIGEHTTPGNYTAADDLFDTIIDEEATGTSVSNTLVKIPASDFGSVVNVRQGKVILPFTQNSTVGDSGDTVTTVRTADSIAT